MLLLVSTNHNESLLLENPKCAEMRSTLAFLQGFPSEEIVLLGKKIEKTATSSANDGANDFISFCFVGERGESSEDERKCFHNNVVNCATKSSGLHDGGGDVGKKLHATSMRGIISLADVFKQANNLVVSLCLSRAGGGVFEIGEAKERTDGEETVRFNLAGDGKLLSFLSLPFLTPLLGASMEFVMNEIYFDSDKEKVDNNVRRRSLIESEDEEEERKKEEEREKEDLEDDIIVTKLSTTSSYSFASKRVFSNLRKSLDEFCAQNSCNGYSAMYGTFCFCFRWMLNK